MHIEHNKLKVFLLILPRNLTRKSKAKRMREMRRRLDFYCTQLLLKQDHHLDTQLPMVAEPSFHLDKICSTMSELEPVTLMRAIYLQL